MNVDQSSIVSGNDANSVAVPKNGIEEGVGRSAEGGKGAFAMFEFTETVVDNGAFEDSIGRSKYGRVPFQVFSHSLNVAYAELSPMSSNLAMTRSNPSINDISVWADLLPCAIFFNIARPSRKVWRYVEVWVWRH